MEDSLRQIWTFCLWYAGISMTVTIGLFGWLIGLTKSVAIKDNIHLDLTRMKESLDEIKTALVGNYEKRGLVTKFHELDERITYLERGLK